MSFFFEIISIRHKNIINYMMFLIGVTSCKNSYYRVYEKLTIRQE